MKSELVKVGENILNLAAVSAAHWEKQTLYVYLVGGRFVSLKGEDAQHVWEALAVNAADLRDKAKE